MSTSEIIDYNGEGRWTREAIVTRYASYASQEKIDPLDLSPNEFSDRGRTWVYPVMEKVIEGIKAGDAACVRIGIEFIEDDAKFMFGKTLKSKTASVLRHASLSESQKQRIRRRVFGLLQAGHVPHEYRDYAKLVRKIGFSASEIPEVAGSNPFAVRFRKYFDMVAKTLD